MLQLPFDIAPFVGGIALAVVGFAPLVAVMLLVRRGRVQPGLRWGALAVAASFGLLTVAEGIAWLLIPQSFLALSIGLALGYVVMLTPMAFTALKWR